MFAIIETGGKQYQVEEGRYIDVELLDAKAEGTVLKNDKAKKVIVYKQRPKKGYRVKRGHRQEFSRVMITKIRTTASKKSSEEASVEE